MAPSCKKEVIVHACLPQFMKAEMKTGITLTDNNDLSYFGLRKVGTGTDLTETTISWTDNWGNAMPGPDDLVFRFLSGGTGNTNTDTDLMTVGDLDGLHVARFTPEGNPFTTLRFIEKILALLCEKVR